MKKELKRSLESQEIQARLQEAASHESDVNIATELVSQALVEACKTAGLKSKNPKKSNKQTKNWFDQERETEKENLKSLGKQISHNPDNSEHSYMIKKDFQEDV